VKVSAAKVGEAEVGEAEVGTAGFGDTSDYVGLAEKFTFGFFYQRLGALFPPRTLGISE